MLRKVTLVLLVAGLVLASTAPLRAAQPETEAALTWLRTGRIAEQPLQNPDGGFSNGFAPASDLGATVEILLAGAAAQSDVATWRSAEGSGPMDFIRAQVQSGVVTDTARLSRVIFAAVVTGEDPRAFAGHDLVAELLATQAETGQFGDSLYAHSYALLALHAAGQPLPQMALELLLTQQQPAGGWAMFGGNAPDSADTNTTALAIQALVAAGKTDAARKALDYLRQVQNEDGGFPWQKPSPWGTATDANSTAVVIQALLTLGEDPAIWKPAGLSPYDALRGLHHAATGGFVWQIPTTPAGAEAEPNVLATAQAIQALEGMTLVQVRALPQTEPVPPLLPQSGGYAAPELLLALGLGFVALGWVTLRRRR